MTEFYDSGIFVKFKNSSKQFKHEKNLLFYFKYNLILQRMPFISVFSFHQYKNNSQSTIQTTKDNKV